MDRWTLVIHGKGPHNSGASGDVDKLAADLVGELRKGGHVDVIATLGHNQCELRIEPEAPATLPSADAPAPPKKSLKITT